MVFSISFLTAALHLVLGQSAAAAQVSFSTCSSTSITQPELFGAEILSITAIPVQNYSATLPQADDHFTLSINSTSFCNITIFYTHPGYNDSVGVSLWLPLHPQAWNGRFLGTGGGGWLAGRGVPGEQSLAYGISQGFAAVSTDAGHTDPSIVSPDSWALLSPGNINWPLLENFAHRSLYDAAIIGKAITESFYHQPINHSYWTGCSTGGRQGLMMAQRYPEVYDGILSAAPAINWAKFLVSEYWPQMFMRETDYFPPACELDAITAAVIAACDPLDGVTDGVISALNLCTYTGDDLIGRPFTCPSTDGNNTTSTQLTFTAKGVQIAQATWAGPRTTSSKFSWYGLSKNSPLTSLSGTLCTSSSNNLNCTGAPFPISSSWIRNFIARDPTFNISSITRSDYDRIFHQSTNHFTSIMGTDDPDLTGLKKAGGKIIMWHGGADQLIPLEGSINYYRRVLKADAEDGQGVETSDYFRFFEAPGVEHCSGGEGYFPEGALKRLVEWVEGGVAPGWLEGRTVPDEKGGVRERLLCAWPEVAVYVGGNEEKEGLFECRGGFGPVRGERGESVMGLKVDL